jgi:hypothetical protein
MRFGVQCRRLDQLVEQVRGFSFGEIGLEASGGYEPGVMRALLAPACPSARSIRSSFGSSPGRAEFWPKTIRSMLA